MKQICRGMNIPVLCDGCRMTLSIVKDDNAPDPRLEPSRISHMVCVHPRYRLGDERGLIDPVIIKCVEEDKNMLVLPLFLSETNVLHISTVDFQAAFTSSCIGIAYISKETALAKLGASNSDWMEKAKAQILTEVKEYDNYLSGNVFGYQLFDADGGIVDACWGFTGDTLEQNGILENAGVTLAE